MSTLLAEAHVFIHRHRCPLSARSRNPHVLLLLGVEDTRSAVSWLHLAASAAHRLNGLADCIDHELGLLLVDVVPAVRVGWDVILSTRLGGSTPRYPAKPAVAWVQARTRNVSSWDG